VHEPCRAQPEPRPCETEQAQGETFVSGSSTHWFCSTSADEESAGVDEKAVVIDKSAISIDEKAVFIDEKAVFIDEKAVLIDEKFDGRPFFHR